MLEYQVFQQIKRFYPQNTGRVSSEDLKKLQEFPPNLLQPFLARNSLAPGSRNSDRRLFIFTSLSGRYPPWSLFLHALRIVWKNYFYYPWFASTFTTQGDEKKKQSWIEKKSELENPGIDPGTSRMLSERSTIWASPPLMSYLSKFSVFKTISYF